MDGLLDRTLKVLAIVVLLVVLGVGAVWGVRSLRDTDDEKTLHEEVEEILEDG